MARTSKPGRIFFKDGRALSAPIPPTSRGPARYKITRTETVVRQEEAEVTIRLIPRPLLREMVESHGWTAEDVARTTREAQEQLDAGRLHITVSSAGDLIILDRCVSQYFTADYDTKGACPWEYNGREVNVLETHYDSVEVL